MISYRPRCSRRTSFTSSKVVYTRVLCQLEHNSSRLNNTICFLNCCAHRTKLTTKTTTYFQCSKLRMTNSCLFCHPDTKSRFILTHTHTPLQSFSFQLSLCSNRPPGTDLPAKRTIMPFLISARRDMRRKIRFLNKEGEKWRRNEVRSEWWRQERAKE